MKTIAVTIWNSIISPVYDASCCMLLIRPDNCRTVFNVKAMSIFEKAAMCETERVSVLICGAISKMANNVLVEKGIKVYSWISGPVEDIIAAYNNNCDLSELYSMPGCGSQDCGCRKRFRRRGRV